MLEGRSLAKSYGNTQALKDVTIHVQAGTSTVILGKSGSGKSTLLRCLAGIEVPDEGLVYFKGRPLSSWSSDARAYWRMYQAGFIFQEYNLLPELTLWENIILPLQLSNRWNQSAKEQCHQLVDNLDLFDCIDRFQHQVSGGQRQRAAVARALAKAPSIIFADEPTGSLDSQNRDIVLNLLKIAVECTGCALVMVTHDTESIWQEARIVNLSDGTLVNGEYHES